MLANPEVSVAMVSLDKKPTGFSIGFWIIAEHFAFLKHLLKNRKINKNKNNRAPKNEV